MAIQYGMGMWWGEMANTYWGKCWGRIYQGKGREDDRKQDGNTRINEIWSTGLRAGEETDRAMRRRKIISYTGDPTWCEKPVEKKKKKIVHGLTDTAYIRFSRERVWNKIRQTSMHAIFDEFDNDYVIQCVNIIIIIVLLISNAIRPNAWPTTCLVLFLNY